MGDQPAATAEGRPSVTEETPAEDAAPEADGDPEEATAADE